MKLWPHRVLKLDIQYPVANHEITYNPSNIMQTEHIVFIFRNTYICSQILSPHETDLDTLHMCYSCVAWSSYGTPNSRKKGCLSLLLLLTLRTLLIWVTCMTGREGTMKMALRGVT